MNNDRLEVQKEQRFASEVLWHFTGRNKTDEESYERILSILENGLNVGETHEEFKFYSLKENKFISAWGYPVNCLADIPLKDLPIHAKRYGSFAIGFNKEKAIAQGFNPVLYINQYSFIFHKFIQLRDEIGVALKDNKELMDKFQEMLLLLGSISKSGNLKANLVNDQDKDEKQINNFYYEREWRSVSAWKFNKNDIAAVIVPDDYLKIFKEKFASTSILEEAVILPFSMVYKF